MKNRITAAVILCLSLLGGSAQTPAYASASGVPSASQESARNSSVTVSEIELNPDDKSASVPVEMKASVTASLISVSLPADGMEFDVKPDRSFDLQTPGAQITSPDMLVENHSVVPVKLEISRVADITEADVQFADKFADFPEQTFRLVDTIAGVGPPGTAILVLGTDQSQYSSPEEFEQGAICPGKTQIYVTRINPEETKVLKLYGKVAADFYGEYQFTIRPTLKISAARADDPAG